MKIYTKTGDLGETALFGGERVKKTHPRVRAYGSLDEANSVLGAAISFISLSTLTPIKTALNRIQNELFQVGSELASPQPAKHLILISTADIERLEQEIDEMEKHLPPLKNFILPGGTPAGSHLHLARTMIRRSERECVELATVESIRPEVVQYLNRLSDYLFVIARRTNQLENAPETEWNPRK